MNEDKREWLDTISKCCDNLKVKNACSIVFNSLDNIENNSEIVKDIESNLGKEVWMMLFNGIIVTIFEAFYINCEIPDEDRKKRIDEFYKIFKDELVGMICIPEDNDKGFEA